MTGGRFSVLPVLVASIALLVASCRNPAGPHLYKVERLLMGTHVELTLVGNSARVKEAAQAVWAEIQRVEDLTSFHKPSGLTALNDHAGQGPFKLAPELFNLIERSLELARDTGGAFDPTVGPLCRAWNFSAGEPRLPEPSEIAELLPKVGWNLVRVNRDERTVELPLEGMALDLGGIAKGYALDRAQEVLRHHGIKAALINAGGDILALGEREPGKPWRVGVQDPRVTAGVRAVINLKDRFIVTSGDYERFFFREARRYHHILDPRTGYPADNLCSVTIVGAGGALADCLSTAVFVLGAEKGLKLIESFPGVEAMVIDSEDRVRMSPGAAVLFEMRP
jgi:thiamine biosynthesis lipoprotein